MSLNGRVRAHLIEHGPSTALGMFDAGLRPDATRTKTSRQRLSTALATMQRAGHVHREGKWSNAVWSITSAGAATVGRAAPTPSVRAPRRPHGPGATWRRVSGEP
jgi:hypothetical protein